MKIIAIAEKDEHKKSPEERGFARTF